MSHQWTYCDLVEINSGFYLWEYENEVPIKENGKTKLFASYEDAVTYIGENDLRITIRNVVSEIR